MGHTDQSGYREDFWHRGSHYATHPEVFAKCGWFQSIWEHKGEFRCEAVTGYTGRIFVEGSFLWHSQSAFFNLLLKKKSLQVVKSSLDTGTNWVLAGEIYLQTRPRGELTELDLQRQVRPNTHISPAVSIHSGSFLLFATSCFRQHYENNAASVLPTSDAHTFFFFWQDVSVCVLTESQCSQVFSVSDAVMCKTILCFLDKLQTVCTETVKESLNKKEMNQLKTLAD